jgi:ribosomal protein L11 methyltransferase
VKNKSIWQVSVETSLEAEEAVVELLGRVFDRPASAYTNEKTKVTVASVYCLERGEWTPGKRAALAAGLELMRTSGLEIGAGRIGMRKVPREDWSESWKRHFKPIEISARLLIKPGWIKRKPRQGQAVVVLDPGLSFGTGNHPTTAFCLRELAARRREGTAQSFWDVGTGSGILAIAAVKLGYAPVRAMDFDPEAVRVARENARRNRVLERMELRRQDITKVPAGSARKHDFICANLISNLLIAEKARIAGRLKRGGTLVVAGILREEFAPVQRAYEAEGLRLARGRVEGEWKSGAFVLEGQRGV